MNIALEGRSVVVTGAGGGIGTAITTRLLAAGAAVVGLDIDQQRLDQLRGGSGTDRLATVTGDSGDEATAARCLSEAERLAPVHGWVNNTARFLEGSLDQVGVGDVLQATDVNLRPAVVGAHAAVRHLLAHGRPGCVVNITSLQATLSLPRNLGYSMAKAAMEALTRNIGVEFGPRGIRSVAVAPGTIRIPGYWAELESLSPDKRERLEEWHGNHNPLARAGDPEEIASVVQLALENEFLNATVIAVNGGWTADSKIGIPPV